MCKNSIFKDETVQGLEHPVKSKYQVLTDSGLAQEFIELRKQIENMQFSSEEGFYLSQEIINRYAYFMKKFSETRGKNEFCSCGSNLKYKNCQVEKKSDRRGWDFCYMILQIRMLRMIGYIRF